MHFFQCVDCFALPRGKGVRIIGHEPEDRGRICAALPGARHSDPWRGGHDAWKVGGKMFACIGSVRNRVRVKAASIEVSALLIEIGRAAWFHRSWLRVDWDTVPEDERRDRIDNSYRIVLGGLGKKARRAITG